jgi:hypothetical protein
VESKASALGVLFWFPNSVCESIQGRSAFSLATRSVAQKAFPNGIWERELIEFGNEKGEQDMRELTPEEVQELGRKWGKHYLSRLSPEDMAGIPLEKRLAGIPLEELLTGIPTKEIRAYLRSLK